MLERLLVQNLATVEKEIVTFSPSFTVLTGETGAGKSVLMKSLQLVLGGKASKDLIRTGKDFLLVEALFSLEKNEALKGQLEEFGIVLEAGEGLVIRRKLTTSGKSTIHVNDCTLSQTRLATIGEFLIDLHSQHSQQTLLQQTTHIHYLDDFAGVAELLAQYQETYRAFREKKRFFEQAQKEQSERARKIDYLQFQVDEIDNAGFTLEEELQLQEEHRLLTHGEQIIGALSPIAEWSNGDYSPLNQIRSELRPLYDILKVAPGIKEIADEIESGLISLEEAASEVNRKLSDFEVDPNRLEQVNERLSELDHLKRKHGNTLEEIFAYRDQVHEELEALTGIEEGQDLLEKEIHQQLTKARGLAKELSKLRTDRKQAFEAAVLHHLAELGLEKSQFEVAVTPLKDEKDEEGLNSMGMDRVEFLITTNPGNPLKPLSKTASGGELSRVMLSIKSALAQDIGLDTIVFDEIDTGISGRVSEAVGVKLKSLGAHRQVICITHSPQIASKADHHLRVQKLQSDEESTTIIKTLTEEERIEEIAKFIGGNEVSQNALSTAQEMLAR